MEPLVAAPDLESAMRRALELAATPEVPRGPNPRVGAVVVGADGEVVGEGFHRGAGTPHAEVVALAAAGARARGGTAVVTLEPCNHIGRTGPCSEALIDAGIARVVFAQEDHNPVAHGGADRLRSAGVEVVAGVCADQARSLNREWTFAVTRGRPFVTWKVAGTLDGRVAAADATSRWITGPAARAEVHALRGRVDAVVVGTGTALADDPQLTARPADGSTVERQPLRVVVGRRALPEQSRLRDDSAPTWFTDHRDPAVVLQELSARECRHVLLEGGPTVAAAFLRADCVDEVVAYVAPVVLGAGRSMVDDLGIETLSSGLRFEVTDVARVGDDVRITLVRPAVTRPSEA